MGTVAQIRTAQGAPPPPAARTPERERLAQAIAADAELEAEIARTSAALDKARSLYRSTEAEARGIEHQIEEIREGAAQRLVDRLMNGDAAGADPLEQLQADLTKAWAAWDVQHGAAQIIEEELRRLSQRRAISRRIDAMSAVVQVEALAALVEEHERRRAQLLETTAILEAVWGVTRYDPHITRPAPAFDHSAAEAWKAAIEQLRGDPDAALPAVANA